MSNNLAPIVLFVYNRPEHTKLTIEALRANELAKESEIFIFSDGPKNEQVAEKVELVRQYISNIDGFLRVSIIEREMNYGLAKSVIEGVSEVINKYGKVIVLEDDLITSKQFLLFMNEALKIYENNDRVYSVTGYSHTTNSTCKFLDDTYFLNIISSWSWGTWKSKWNYFEKEIRNFEKIYKDRKLRFKFNYDNSFDYTGMVKAQNENKISSWAIIWYVSIFNRNGLTLYPKRTLVKNNGFDGSGVHCGFEDNCENIKEHEIKLNFTKDIEEKPLIRKEVAKILKRKHTFLGRIKLLLKMWLLINNK
jgi:hypothetical protein